MCHLLARLVSLAIDGAGRLRGAWPATRQVVLLPRSAIMAVNCLRLQGVMRSVRLWRILAFMTPQFPKMARAVLPPRSHRLKRIFMTLGMVLIAIIAASMMLMRQRWLGAGQWRFWERI